jgi:hypothetical protein
MLPKIKVRKAGDVQRSKEIVAELEKIDLEYEKVKGDPVAVHKLNIRSSELKGELDHLTAPTRYAISDEIHDDLEHVNQYFKMGKDIKTETEYRDVITHIHPKAPPLQKFKTADGKELIFDPSLSEKWEKEHPMKEAVHEVFLQFHIVTTNRHQVWKLVDILKAFRKKVQERGVYRTAPGKFSEPWHIDQYDEEKKKVMDEIAAIDMDEMKEERLDEYGYEMLLYQIREAGQRWR